MSMSTVVRLQLSMVGVVYIKESGMGASGYLNIILSIVHIVVSTVGVGK